MDKKEIKCSFCGRDKQDTNVLIAGITGHICDGCITQAQNIIQEELSQRSRSEMEGSLIPVSYTHLTLPTSDLV